MPLHHKRVEAVPAVDVHSRKAQRLAADRAGPCGKLPSKMVGDRAVTDPERDRAPCPSGPLVLLIMRIRTSCPADDEMGAGPRAGRKADLRAGCACGAAGAATLGRRVVRQNRRTHIHLDVRVAQLRTGWGLDERMVLHVAALNCDGPASCAQDIDAISCHFERHDDWNAEDPRLHERMEHVGPSLALEKVG